MGVITIPPSGGGGGGGAGDASAANQTTQISAANLTNTKLEEVKTKQDTQIASLATIATQSTVTKGSGVIDSNTQRVTLATDGPGVVNLQTIATQTDIEKNSGVVTARTQRTVTASNSPDVTELGLIKTSVQLIDDTVGTIGATAPTRVQAMGIFGTDGNSLPALATENGALGIGNGMKKFRDGFADLAQNAGPDSTIWDVAWTNQGTGFAGRAGNAQGASYMKISMCPIQPGSEFSMTTKRSFKYPMRFINMLSLSQRNVGQEFEVSIVGVDGVGTITTLTPRADLTILGTVSITSNVATINFATAHGLQTGDRVILVGNTERRLNVGPVTVTVVTATSITVPCTLANATYTAGGVVRWADPLAYAKNGAGLLHENATATNANFLTRRNGFNTRQLNSTITTTANAANVAYADPFNATSMNLFIANQEEFTVIPRSPDSSAIPGAPLKWHQGIPDEELEYKIRIRAKNLDNMTRPIARITAIAKTGTTTATVTTDVAHGLAVTDFVQIFGVRDITNFPNLSASTQVASIVSPTQFTIIIGAAVTASSAGGGVWINQGSVLAQSVTLLSIPTNVQSISRAANVLSVVGNIAWTTWLPGETFHLYGCDATSMGLYDGAYKVLRINTTSLELESVGADFGSINCGGVILRRTDFRIHAVSEIEHTRLIAELSNAQGSADNSKAMPVNIPGGVVINSGTVTTVSTLTGITNALPVGANVIGQVGLQIPGIVADVASAALTTTTTTAAFTPTFGTAYQVNIPVTVVTGTTPTLDVVIEESDDSAVANWFPVYSFPRITAVGAYRSPVLRMRGNRVRYVQTVTGTTPSFTRAVNRLQASHAATQIVQLIDRTIVPNTLNSATPAFLVEGCQDFNFLVRCTAQTTAATLTLQFSHDGTNWHTTGNTLATIVGFAHGKVANEQWKFARLIVTAAGTGITLAEVMIVGLGQ